RALAPRRARRLVHERGRGSLELGRGWAAAGADGPDPLGGAHRGCERQQQAAEGGEDEERDRKRIRVARAEIVDRAAVGGWRWSGLAVGSFPARVTPEGLGRALGALCDLRLQGRLDVVGGARIVAQVLRQVADRVAIAVEWIDADRPTV